MGIFSTERPTTVSLDKLAQERLDRQINLDLLRAKNAAERQAMEDQKKAIYETQIAEDKARKQAAMEAMSQKTLESKARDAYRVAFNTMPEEARTMLIKNFVFHIVHEGLWLDDQVKDISDEQVCSEMMEAFNTAISKCEAATGKTFMQGMNNTKYLQMADELITEVSDKAVSRILTEAAETKEISINFNLNNDESDELYDKISELQPEEVSQRIREKVLNTVKDEKACGQVKAELFKELDEAEKQEEEELTSENPADESDQTEDDANPTAESLVGHTLAEAMSVISSKEGVNEGYGIRVMLKLGDKEAKNKNYTKALECYSKAGDMCEFLRNSKRTLPSAEYEVVKESLSNAMTARAFAISTTSKRASARDDFSVRYVAETMNDALLDLSKYCSLMESAVRTRNIQTDTLQQIQARRNKDRINTVLRRSTGKSLFESMLISNSKVIEKMQPVFEGGEPLLAEDIQNAAMLQTILEYTIYETLNTLKIFDFNINTVNKLKAM